MPALAASASAAADTGADSIPIFLLKTKSTPHDGYADFFSTTKLRAHALAPTFVPVLEHRLLEPGLDTVRQLLRARRINSSGDEGTYGGMIFTSQRAVEAFASLVDEGAADASPSPSNTNDTRDDDDAQTWPYLATTPIYTVGPATTRALRSIPTSPPLHIHGSHTGNGAALADYMLTHYPPPPSLPTPSSLPPSSPPPPVLFLVGETRRDIIPTTLTHPSLPPARRIRVDEIEVYGTRVMSPFEAHFSSLLAATRAAPTRWVVVFSPTGCEAALRALGMLDPGTGRAWVGGEGVPEGPPGGGSGRTYVATIGPTTRDYLREEFGFEPHVCAETPSPDGVGEAIEGFMGGLL